MDYRLNYERRNGVQLVVYKGFDWEGSVVDRKSTFECCFSFRSAIVSWFSRKQKSVALSTIEAEYMVASLASCETIWCRKLLMRLFDQELETTLIHCDNQSYIKLSENPVFHDRSKHIEIKYHYIRDMVQRGAVKLLYLVTEEQIANVLTKPLVRLKFEYFRERLGVLQIEASSQRQ